MGKKKKLYGAPCFKSSHVLAILYIIIASAQQPAALMHHRVVMVPLFTLQIDQICDVPFLHVTFPVCFTMLLRQFHLHYTSRF